MDCFQAKHFKHTETSGSFEVQNKPLGSCTVVQLYREINAIA